MKVVIVSSRPKMPILLKRSVVAQATEKIPSDTGPSSRAIRTVKTDRKFEVTIAMVLRNAPRFNSAPASSARRARSPGSGTVERVVSIAINDRVD